MKKLLKDLPLSTKFFESRLKIDFKHLPAPQPGFFIKVSLAAAFILIACFWASEYTSNQISQQTLSDYETALDETQHQLTVVKRRNNELENTLRETQNQLDAALQSKQTLESNYRNLESNFENLKARFLQMWEKTQDRPTPEMDFQNGAFQSSEIRILDPKTSAENQVTVNPVQEKIIRGAVLKVNPVYGFAIVNVGREQGIREGDYLHIFRDELPLDGKLRVDRLYDTIAACSVFLDDPSVTLRPGDAVMRR